MSALGYVYVLSNENNTVLYIGTTNDLLRRVWVHKEGLNQGFTKKYRTCKLVYYEEHDSMVSAIVREKQMKKWMREWKIKLIEKQNPQWEDLYDVLTKG